MSQLTLENLFGEKYPLYLKKEALLEAERCLYCYDPPCVKACPTNIDIPNFIGKIRHNNTLGAAKTIFSANILGDSCAKVCPVEVLCAGACVLNHRNESPIAIGRLQRFATETTRKNYSLLEVLGPRNALSSKKIAFIGAGVASVAAAAMLAQHGHKAVIYEKRNFPGGLNSYGIAPYKLKYDDALEEINWLSQIGVEFIYNTEINEEKAANILAKYDAIFLGPGIGKDKSLPLSNNHVMGVYGATELVEKIKTDANFTLKNITNAHVIGGGNTAIDLAHELALLKVPHVSMLYRGTKDSMSGYAHEMALARAAGVHFFESVEVKEIIAEQGKLVAIKTSRQEIIQTQMLVWAIGQTGGTDVAIYFPDVERDERRLIKVNAQFRTNNKKIWSAGDAVNGGKEVVNAVAEAKIAVLDMLEFLKS